MNKEYVYLSDTEILVTDELGNNKKRKIENKNIHEILVLENKLEEINEIIIEFEEIIKKDDKLNLKEKETIIQLIIPFIISIASYGITFLITPSLLSFQNIISIILGATINTITLDIFIIVYRNNKRKYLNEAKYMLAKANSLREKFEQQLSKLKEHSNVNNEENTNVRTNETIFLEETPSLYEEITKTEEPKVKKRILKKENKQ